MSIDDPHYVVDNPHIRGGLSADSVAWAFSLQDPSYAPTWHPLTWLSHMLDWQLFGDDPSGHHGTNVVLHALNAALLFMVLRAMTNRPGPSAFAAALFAVHPLNVESVAWVSQRKTLLSMFFGLLAIRAYSAYSVRGGIGRYLAAALWFVLGVLAKPMLVTLPLIFLLLDYWPLDRISPSRDEAPDPGAGPRALHWKLAIEKIPLVAISVAVSLATLRTQASSGAVIGSGGLPIHLGSVLNAVLSYVSYLAQTVWPTDLGILVPHPFMPGSGAAPVGKAEVLGSALLLTSITGLTLRMRSRRYLLVGWFWYVIAMIPMIGLIQVGSQGTADRYTYLPNIGLYIAIAWGGEELAARLGARRRWARTAALCIGAASLVALSAATLSQTQHWRSSIALYRRAVAINADNSIAQYALAFALDETGDTQGAIRHLQESIRVNGRASEPRAALARVFLREGRSEAAISELRAALEIAPDDAGLRRELERAVARGATKH